jgi:hypothetical protein
MAKNQIDVTFTNPFYHNQLGLLGGSDDHDTIYTLPSDTVLPQSAIVIEGESEHRKNNPPKSTHSRSGKFSVADLEPEDVNEAYEADAQQEREPARKKPIEGKTKNKEEPIKRRKAVNK